MLKKIVTEKWNRQNQPVVCQSSDEMEVNAKLLKPDRNVKGNNLSDSKQPMYKLPDNCLKEFNKKGVPGPIV